MPFCNKCGTEVAEGINFCGKCGYALNSGQPTNQSSGQNQTNYTAPVGSGGTPFVMKINNKNAKVVGIILIAALVFWCVWQVADFGKEKIPEMVEKVKDSKKEFEREERYRQADNKKKQAANESINRVIEASGVADAVVTEPFTVVAMYEDLSRGEELYVWFVYNGKNRALKKELKKNWFEYWNIVSFKILSLHDKAIIRGVRGISTSTFRESILRDVNSKLPPNVGKIDDVLFSREYL